MKNPNKTIRWKQRFSNFKNSYHHLEKACAQSSLNDLERAGLIQLFELTFELAWKTLKDFLDAQGITVRSPRETIKEAFALSYISNGEIWLDALDDRNTLTHTYDEDDALEAEDIIKNNYVNIMKDFYTNFLNYES